jgi:SAM-dependent methyltransferase
MLATETAHHWLDRWDRQQEVYIADREERFAVIADVVEAVAERPDPLVVDLGCGPGSLAARLLERLPGASVVGVDADPLLLGMARAGYGDRPGLQFVEGDLRTSGWAGRLGLDRAPDALVSTTALHWMNRRQFGRLVTDAAELLRPGGVFVNGDHVYEGDLQPHLDRLQLAVRAGRERRVRAGGDEDWKAWWDAVERAPELAELVAARAATGVEHAKSDTPTYTEHLGLLRAAGFTEAGTVWQTGDDRVLVAIKER